MPLNPHANRALRIAAVAQAINAVEGLVRHRQFGSDGLLAGQAHRRASALPARAIDAIDSHAGAVAVHGLALASAVVQLVAPPSQRKSHLAAAAASLAANKLFALRNPYGRDGADQMLGVIYGYRLATSVIPRDDVSDDIFLRAVNAQAALSYATAGLAKSLSAEWLSGSALELVLRTRVYGSTDVARAIVERPWVGRILSWSTIAWETSFPVIYLLPPRQARVALWGAKAFHLAIAYTMGLPRFFWSFSASHEAVAYVLAQRGRRG